MISFIVPAKNVSLFVNDLYGSFLNEKAQTVNWELVFVDDNSSDDTYHLLKLLSERDDRVRVYKNPGNGKVDALNYAYSKCVGEFVKAVDSDDVLTDVFWREIEKMISFEVTCHDYSILDSDLNYLSSYKINPSVAMCDVDYFLMKMTSLPRCVWTFNRRIGDVIFPIPRSLPFEDVWFNYVIIKNNARIEYFNKDLYGYRQHENQTFGGILNFSPEIMSFRAGRILKYIDYFKSSDEGGAHRKSLMYSELYYSQLFERTDLISIIRSGLRLSDRLKLILYTKFYYCAPIIAKAIWFFRKFA